MQMKSVKPIFIIAVFLSSVLLVLAANTMLPSVFDVSSRAVDKKSGGTMNLNKKAALAESVTTIPVVADSRLEGPQGNSNYGSSTDLVVKQTNASSNTYNRMSIFKFDLSGIDESKGRIVKAELQLFVKSNYDAMNSATKRQNFNDTPFIIAYSKEDSWGEMTVTWNNYAPYAQAGAELARVMGNAIPYSSTGTNNWAIPANQQITWDITNGLRKDYLSDDEKLLSLVLTSTSVGANMGITFHSKENGNANYIPHLVIYQDSDQPFTLPEDTAPTIYDKVLENVRKVLYDEAGSFSSISSNAQNYLNSINSDGSWSDLTYTGDVPTNHLDRLKTMALAYTNSQSSLYGNVELYTAIVNGIQWWYDKNPDHSNWFYDQIAYPQRMGETLVLMRNGTKKLPVKLELNTLARMKSQGGAPDQSGSQGTGANKMNIAMHWIYRGCLTEDQAVLDKAVQQVFYPLGFTTGEGLQHDYSYLQHGLQLYIGGYGWDIVNVATRVALYTVETPYAQGNADLDNLGAFLRQAYLRVIRGQNFMFNAFGRGIARPNGVGQSGFGTLLKRMKVIEPAYAAVYDEAMARLAGSQPASYGVEAKHTHFYRADYTLQTRPDYTIELRTVSNRTLRNENGNGENIRGYFLADGATSIAVTGTEYYNVFPTWDWSMVPGTTTRKGTMVTPGQWGTAGNTTFVGGVSDTLHGVSVYDLDNNSTKAKKSWFFFDDEVVCLGAGIAASGSQEVVTTLNQCLLQGDVIAATTESAVNTYSGNNTTLDYSGNLQWAIQGNVGYVLPDGGNVGLTAKAQTGKWSTINTDASADDVTQNVFTLWMKHGVSPSNAKYAYIVVPNVNSAAQMQNYMAKGNIEILKNEATLQAVRHKGLGLNGFVFYDETSKFINDTINIEVSKPCLLMVQPIYRGKVKLHISDPTKSLSQITVKVAWPGLIGTKEVTVNLPTGDALAGKSVVTYLNEEHTELVADNDDLSNTTFFWGESTPSVLRNDTYNGASVIVGTTPGTVTLSSTNVPSELEFNTTTGIVKVKPNAAKRTYSFEYTICENGATSANCKTATVKVKVSDEKVIAHTDDFTSTPITAGGSTASVLDNDTYNDGAVVVGTTSGTVTLSSTNVPSELEFNTATGVVKAKPNAPSGTYDFDYSICANGADADGCVTAHVQIVVQNVFTAKVDNPDPINGYTGGESSSVLVNDTFNGDAILPGIITLSVLQPASPINGDKIPELDTQTGKVIVDAQTPAGQYKIIYQICEYGTPSDNCVSTSVTIVVEKAELKAEADRFVVEISPETARTASVLENDKLNNTALMAGQYVLTPGNPSNTALSMDNTGVITVPSGLKAGMYTYSYTVCEVLNPNNCAQAIATIELKGTQELSVPNIFTPNGDGKNQYFKVYGIESYDHIELTILNKAGDQLYTNPRYDNRWDGSGLGSGTYLYFIKAFKGQEVKTIKGYITIKRY